MITSFLCIIIILSILYLRKKPVNPELKNSPPEVEGGWPYFGLGLSFGKDIIGFIQKCRKKYGDVFKIKIFSRKMIVICNRNYLDTYFNSTEEEMSLVDALRLLYFGDAFSENTNIFDPMISIIKKSITFNSDEFTPKIMEEAKKVIKNLPDNEPFSLNEAALKFVSKTSSRCFLGVTLDDEQYELLKIFSQCVNKVVVLTYFFPKWLLKRIYGKTLHKYRTRMVEYHKPIIMEYCTNPNYKKSTLLRSAVDYFKNKKNENNIYYNDNEICIYTSNIILCLLYVSSENTALGTTNTLYDLCGNPEYWARVRNEATPFIESQDYKGFLKNETIDNAIMESARLGAHIFPLGRKPKNLTKLGKYYIGDVDVVSICSPMLMTYGTEFKDPKRYNPDRFLEEDKRPRFVMTWGAGKHLCPGKLFAIGEMKAFIALITYLYKNPKILEVGSMNYFSPSAFGERKITMSLDRHSKDDYLPCVFDEAEAEAEAENNKPYVEIQCKTTSAYYFPSFINIDEQINIYNTLFEGSKNSTEHKILSKNNKKKYYPFAYENLVYTGTSNFNGTHSLYELASNVTDILNIQFNPNSMYAALFYESMREHYDEHVNFGLSISLGSSCVITLDGQELSLHSGDVLFGDFSKIKHGIKNINYGTAPTWFRVDENDDIVNTYGYKRCSIQIREVNKNLDMSIKDYYKMLK